MCIILHLCHPMDGAINVKFLADAGVQNASARREKGKVEWRKIIHILFFPLDLIKFYCYVQK